MDSLLKEWSVFLDRCLQKRVKGDLFESAAKQLYRKSPISGRKLAELLLRPRAPVVQNVDPRVIIYLERLLALKRVDASDVLISALKYSKDRPPRPGEEALPAKNDRSRWQNPPELDEIIFHRLHKAFSSGDRPAAGTRETQLTLLIVSHWMSSMVSAHTSDSMLQAMAGIQQPHQQSINVREALGMLVVGLIENIKVIEVLNKESSKDLRKTFAQSLSSFIPFLSQTSMQISQRLELSQKEHDFHDTSMTDLDGATGENGLDVNAALQVEAVMDLPSINTRAGLYIFLNALLVARPLTDDLTIINYLHSRYKADTQNNMATDLIIAAFDVLLNAMHRGESSQIIFSLKSSLVNKIPILLTQLQASMLLTSEFCITQAFNHIDPNAFPSFTQGFDISGSNNQLADVRQDFLNACALHNLIPANIIQRLSGEAPMQGPPEVRYVKADLLKQCKDNFEKVNALIDEIEVLNGNGGAIVGAITEFVSHLCETQMTMYLKTICNLLSKKPQALDVILQFTSPTSILKPLCEFLDGWRYDGDQGEYQPIYDEFGAILVFIQAFTHRYHLSYHDLGINHDSFVAQVLERGHRSVERDDITDEQGKHLGKWLQGLFGGTDEGIGDELMSSCHPQEFYLLVPTLFAQTVYACSAGVLSFDVIKGGLDFLLETFLLPSLVGALTWMSSHALKQTHHDLNVLVQIFNKLIRPSSISGEAQAMHGTILSIVSSRLEKCFRTLRRREASRSDIEPLLEAIKGHLHYERSAYASMSELEQWTSTPGNTLRGSVRSTVRELSIWSSAGAIQISPPGYTHRQLYTAIKVLGANKTLRAILDEVKAQAETGNGAVALDIATSLVCAPSTDNSPLPVEWIASTIPAPQPPRSRMNLREMLKAEFDNAASLVSNDPLSAEAIVRLHRRVEAQLAIVATTTVLHQTAANLGLDATDVANMGVGDTMPDLDMNAVNDAAAAAAAGVTAPEMDQQALQRELEQMGAGGGAGDLDLNSLGNIGGTGAADMMDLDLGTNVDLDMASMGMGGGGEDDWGLDFDNM